MDCPICNKEMTIEEVETSSAHLGLVRGSVDIIGPDTEDMYWCEDCRTSEPLENRDDFDWSDDARDNN